MKDIKKELIELIEDNIYGGQEAIENVDNKKIIKGVMKIIKENYIPKSEVKKAIEDNVVTYIANHAIVRCDDFLKALNLEDK